MKLFKMIKLKLDGRFYSDIAIQLGYQNHTTAINRLHMVEVTQDTYEWIKSSSYDLKYSNEEFLIQLCKLLVIAPPSYKVAIANAKIRLSNLQKMKQPYIFVNTNFKRKNETLISLSSLHHTRILPFDKESYLYTREKEFLDMASSQIKEHYLQHDGELDLWGKIKNYTFYDRHGISHTFNTDGVKTSEEFEDLFHYMARFKFERDDNNMEFSESDKDRLFSMIFDDVKSTLLKSEAPYKSRISDLQPMPFNTENIKAHFTSNTKGLFFMEYHSLLVYIELNDKIFSMYYMPIHFHFIDDYFDKSKLYAKLYTYLQLLVSQEEISTKIPQNENMKKLFKKSCVDYLYDDFLKHGLSSIRSGLSCRLLKELHTDKSITTKELIEYLTKFKEVHLEMGDMRGHSWIKRLISKV